MYCVLTLLTSRPPHKLSLVISLTISLVNALLQVALEPVPFLPVCEVVPDGVVCLLQESIIRAPRARPQQLQHPEPIPQLDPQPNGEVSERETPGEINTTK